MPNYLPVQDRPLSHQYRDVLRRILTEGERVSGTLQGVDALTLMQQTMAFDLSSGFPCITERDISAFWDRPIGELCAFINGATTLAELEEFGCTWWGPWVDETRTKMFGLPPDTIGPASYGGAFAAFPTLDGGRFDQFPNLVEQIKSRPGDRVHFVSPWMPQENSRARPGLQRTTIAPCHGWVHVRVINERLHVHMYQRAGDVPVGVPSNMVQYAALALMLEHLTGYEAAGYYHTISDAHIYANQAVNVEELLLRDPRSLPTVALTAAGRQVSDIRDFRREHFVLTDYEPHAAMSGIPVST